ncbi:uncharacterized protein [Centruroides vittatus]|uniref:uncharacterized protein n=1 Tax=Centruroides vittatus TaxID=120091 RepID=UPI003510CFFE
MSNELELPKQGQVQIKKLNQKEKRKNSIRIGTLNIGTLNGKSRDLVDLMQRRVNILCLQDTRWKGNKAKELGEEYKLFVSGKGGRNGVGIVIDKVLKDSVCEVKQRCVRIMSVKLDIGGIFIMIVCVYAPQPGSGEEEKTNFWTDLDQVIMCVHINHEQEINLWEGI